MAAGVDRIEPLERGDPRAGRPGHGRVDRLQPGAELGEQPAAALGLARGLREPNEVLEHLVEGLGVKREDGRAAGELGGDAADVVVGDGAHGAERLGHDQVGRELAQGRVVEPVQRLAARR